MAVSVKSEREIELMRESGRILGEVHDKLKEIIRPGISTLEIDIEGEKLIRSYDCIPNFLHYNGFPGSICVSINEEVVHGIPKKSRILKEGDIVSLDCGLIYKGYHSDAARTYPVGEVDPEVLKLIEETRNSFFEGIKFAKEGNHLHDISNAIDAYISKFGY
ncbi:MAG: type I methionyl aminopeptidase, partial [Lachnospiraceae bacterium]|nr:type I methionyl aminopeptidase [Lachnospiraceae bacterium]